MKRICDRRIDLEFPVSLIQTGVDRFTVTYGKQTKSGLDYAQAACEYGACVMHALACAGKLDNHERGRA
jgi:hypothetical protein